MYEYGKIIVGRMYKISYEIKSISGGQLRIWVGNGGADRTTIGVYTEYLKATSTVMGVQFSNTTCSIDNLSIQEIGWSGSQELYDGIYAQTAGTVEQKTYAAVKASAMWCNYNNDAPTGLIYGKLYNWFAVKLFQMDIDYYNVTNPTKPYIWRIPTQAEFQTLSTYLGGDSVSGRHLKENGLTHWNSPNTGADNSSGFNALPSGYRDPLNGPFMNNTTYAIFWSITKYRYLLTQASQSMDGGIRLESSGFSIRLIKS